MGRDSSLDCSKREIRSSDSELEFCQKHQRRRSLQKRRRPIRRRKARQRRKRLDQRKNPLRRRSQAVRRRPVARRRPAARRNKSGKSKMTSMIFTYSAYTVYLFLSIIRFFFDSINSIYPPI